MNNDRFRAASFSFLITVTYLPRCKWNGMHDGCQQDRHVQLNILLLQSRILLSDASFFFFNLTIL